MLKIKTGDKIIVISGQYKGVKGKVIGILPKQNKVIIKGMGRIRQEFIIYLCKLALIDPISEKPTRIGFKLSNGKKYRVAKRSGTELKKII